MTDPSRTVLAIDIGGTKIAFADIEDNQPRNRHQIRTPRTGRGDDLVGAIVDEVGRRRPSTIAVATTGIVSGERLSALNPGTLPIENGFPLTARIRELTGVTPLIVNDAQAAAWGEYRFGAGQGCRNFMFVTVSTGVGGGLVLDDRLDIGGAGLAGHLGHMTVVGGNSSCGCGRKGCLETLASGTAIARRFRETRVRRSALLRCSGLRQTAMNWPNASSTRLQRRSLKPSPTLSRRSIWMQSRWAVALAWLLVSLTACAGICRGCPRFSSVR